MKAEITMDPVSKSGVLRVTPETPLEAFALYHWWQSFNMGDNSSIFHCNYDNPVPLPESQP